MAERYAISAGNWVAARFDGGTLPGVGDTVHANGFAVTIDTSITVDALSTRAGAIALAGGSFTATAVVTINADVYGGTSSCLTVNVAGAIVNGNLYGGTSTSAVGANIGAGVIHNGNTFGGSGFAAHGSTLNGRQNGDATGSLTTANCLGTSALQGAIIVGDSYGKASQGVTVNNGARQIGDAYASDTASQPGTLVSQGAIFNGRAIGGDASGRVGCQVNQRGIAFVTEAVGTVSGAFGVQSQDLSHVIITAETGAFAKSLSAGTDTTFETLPFADVGAGGSAGFTGIRGTSRTLGT